MPDPHQLDVAILGAGITGLPAAWKLKEAGRAVRVFEKNRRIGGPIESYRSQGFLFEKGPNTIQVDGQDLLDTINGLGIGDQLIEKGDVVYLDAGDFSTIEFSTACEVFLVTPTSDPAGPTKYL